MWSLFFQILSLPGSRTFLYISIAHLLILELWHGARVFCSGFSVAWFWSFLLKIGWLYCVDLFLGILFYPIHPVLSCSTDPHICTVLVSWWVGVFFLIFYLQSKVKIIVMNFKKKKESNANSTSRDNSEGTHHCKSS